MHMETISPAEIPLVDKLYLLEKFHGKGGWTFAAIPEIKPDKHAYFGLVKVKGSIDGYEIANYNLMPMGNGLLFLPVKAEIRKKIGKNEGEWVHIILYSAGLPKVVNEDFQNCLMDDPTAWHNFNDLALKEQNAIIDWIYSVRNDELKVQRIADTLNKLSITKVK